MGTEWIHRLADKWLVGFDIKEILPQAIIEGRL